MSSRLAREQDEDIDDVVAWLTPGKVTRGGGLAEPVAQARGKHQGADEQRGGIPLPENIARQLADELGVDLRDVRIHSDERAARAAAAISSRAFTVGNDIYFAAGAYQPDTDEGVDLIAHEVAHIAHAKQGKAAPRKQLDSADELVRERQARRAGLAQGDPGALVDNMREQGRRIDLPFVAELEEHFGTSLDYVEAYTGEAAELACRLMAAGAFAVRNVVAFADPSPQRETLMHELTHVIQSGGRMARAPARFGTGSLGVGAAGTAVEREASMHIAQPTVHADLNTVHRTPGNAPNPAGTTDQDADTNRVVTFAGGLGLSKPPEKEKLRWAIKTGERATARFYSASPPFGAGTYARNPRTKADLDAVMAKNGEISNDYRLHQTGDKYIISYVGATVGAYTPGQAPVEVTADKGWVAYTKACKKIAEARKIEKLDFTWTSGAKGPQLKADDPAISETEFKDFREPMRIAIADVYARSDGEFSDFYKEVVQGTDLPNKTKGSIFEALVGKCAGERMGIDGAAATSAIPVWDKRTAASQAILQTFKKNRLDGDGVVVIQDEGIMAITEAKAYAKGGGPTSSDTKKMGQYYALIEKKVPGFVNLGAAGMIPFVFNHAFYNIAMPQPSGEGGKYSEEEKAVLKKWLAALYQQFQEKPVAGKEPERFSLHPPPDGSYSFKVKFNPELQFDAPADAKSIDLTNPPVKLPGLQLTHIKAQVDDQGMISSGTVTYGIDAGDLKKAPETKPLTPNKDGVPGGQVDNKVTGLKSKLAEILPVDIDARIVEGGVEATMKLKQGAAKGIAGFVVDAAEIKATYLAVGSLAVDAEISLHHQSGKISAKVKLGYDGGWTFEGKVTISEGLIPGVSNIEGLTISRSASGEWKIGADLFKLEQKLGAVTLTGHGRDLEYNVKTGMFKGDLQLDADLGMFGNASGTASIENNKLAKGSISYDSPAFKYPAKSDKPAFTGTVGGTLTYNNGKLSGDIRGSANIAVPALKKIAGDKGIALDVDGHIDEHGAFSGTVRSTNPLKFGKHLEIPTLSCTIEKDGSLSGEFAVKVVNIKHLETAQIACTVNKNGITVKSAHVTVSFGDQEKGKFWGSLTAGYSEEKGLDISGTVNYKIKDDMIATGTLTYQQGSNAVTLEMKVSEITLMDKKISKTLFKASKQIPIVNVYGLGIYVDIGFDLGFDFGFKITMTPEVDFIGLSLDTWKFEKIAAKLKVGGDVFAQLTGTPKLGIGVFALDPSIIRGGGGLKVPIVGRLDIKPSGEFGVDYKSDGGIGGTARLGLAGQFGITGSLKPYAEFSVLNDMWNPTWEGEALASFEILKPKELFNFTIDLAGDKDKDQNKDGPPLPGENEAKAPKAPTGDKTQTATPAAPEDKGSESNKGQPAKQGEVAESGDQGPFSLDGLLGKFQSNPTVATATKIFNWAKKVWKVIKPIFDVVEPIVNLIGKRIEAIIDLFDIETPTGDNLGPWLWKLAGKLFNVAFGGLVDIANAIRTIFGAAGAFAQKFITKSIKDGQIGVKRHSFYIWRPWPFDDYEFMAAAEYKVKIPGIADLGQHGPPGFLLEPSGAIALVLYEALEAVGIGYTYTGKSDINQPYNDIWYGAGARG